MTILSFKDNSRKNTVYLLYNSVYLQQFTVFLPVYLRSIYRDVCRDLWVFYRRLWVFYRRLWVFYRDVWVFYRRLWVFLQTFVGIFTDIWYLLLGFNGNVPISSMYVPRSKGKQYGYFPLWVNSSLPKSKSIQIAYIPYIVF